MDRKRVGILDIEKLIEVKRPVGPFVLIPKIDVILDFHPEKEIDEHELQEVIHSAIEDALREEITSIDSFGASIVKKLLKKTDTLKAEVKMEAEYVVYRHAPVSKQRTQETYKLISRAIGEEKCVKKMIGAEVVGINSCPCAQEGLEEYARRKLKNFSQRDIERIIRSIPIASHNQRNISTLLIEVPEKYNIEAEDLIEILEESMSSKVYEVLKREDEVEVVIKSHMNPNFVEDTVRKILIKVVQKYRDLPGESVVIARSESLESIHQHNAVAERVALLKELRREISSAST
jgi:GTP cyclohydrolase-4